MYQVERNNRIVVTRYFLKNNCLRCTVLSIETYGWNISQPTIHYSFWEGQHLCRACNIFFQGFVCLITFSQRYRTQPTAENRVVFKMYDFPHQGGKKHVQDAAVFSGSSFLKFQPRQFMHNDGYKNKTFTTHHHSTPHGRRPCRKNKRIPFFFVKESEKYCQKLDIEISP